AGVACGLPYADAQRLAAATVEGAARMVQQSTEHPAQLRNRVCSPGGSTIAGVLSMENRGFRAAVSEGVCASFERTKELGK
ncbi:MAG: pyrroline-5-carboxylate reductase, partial [Clostridia bacterium]|nr:pyrroline-5-carboxylate reductase [Clostridia bacterium]